MRLIGLIRRGLLSGAAASAAGGAYAAELAAVRLGAESDRTRIVFDLDGVASHDARLSKDRRSLVVVLTGVSATAPRLGRAVGVAGASSVETRPDGLVVTTALREDAVIRRSFVLDGRERGARRIVVDLAPAPAPPAVVAVPPASTVDEAPPPPRHADACATIRRDRMPDRAAPTPDGVDRFRCTPQPEIAWKSPNRVVVAYAPERLTLTQSLRLGADVIPLQKHIHAGALGADRSWRSEVDATTTLVDGDDARLDLSVGLFDMRRPLPNQRGGVGAERFDNWQSSANADAALSLSAFAERLRAAAGYGWSESAWSRRREDEPWLWVYDAPRGERRSRAGGGFLSLDADLLHTDALAASASFSYTGTGPGYRSFQTDTVRDILYEGETLAAATSVAAGGSKLRVEYERHDETSYGYESWRAKLVRGAVTLRARLSDEVAAGEGAVYVDDRTAAGDVTLDIGRAFGDIPAWAPDEVRLGFSRRDARDDTVVSSSLAERVSYGVGASKSGAHFSTDVYVYRNMRDDLSARADFKAASEWGADVSQSFFGEGWDFSIYANMSDLRRERRFFPAGDERIVSGGASFMKRFRDLPTFRLAFDAFRYSADYVRDEYAFMNRDLGLRAEIEFAESLLTGEPTPADNDRPLSLYLAAYRGWSVFRDNYDNDDPSAETRFMLLLRRPR